MKQRELWQRLNLLGMMLLALPGLVGCGHLTSGVGTANRPMELRAARALCPAWQPITWSTHDTAETIQQVKAGNAARDAACGDP